MITRYMVLGGPVPPELQAALAGVVELVADGGAGDDDVDGLLVHARTESLPVFRRFRRRGGSLPIFALAEGPVEIASRVQWIRHGADDLLDPATAAETLRRKLRTPSPVSGPSESDRGMFLDRYLRCMHRYVLARQELMARMGDAALSRYLDCVYLRDQALRAAEDAPVDAFGQRRGGQREPLRWPITLVGVAEGTGELLNVGADGCACLVNHAPSERLSIRLQTGAVTAHLDVDVRWQRRVGRDRWEFGGLVVGVNLG